MATSSSDTSHKLQHDVSGATTTGVDHLIPIRGPEHISYEVGPWAQKTILTFDGGGIRGYASLLVLKRIMNRIRELETQHNDPAHKSSYYRWIGVPDDDAVEGEPDPKRVDRYLPCHYFDYIAGTSTGGLSSIMLGRLRMSVDQALDTYKSFGNAVFGKPRRFHELSLSYWPRAKYSCRQTREAYKKIIYDTLQRERECDPSEVETEQLKYREDRTRTIAISWAINKKTGVNKEFVWRSYANDFRPKENDPTRCIPSNAGPAHRSAIWKVARATTAAPGYFEAIKLMGMKFIDGGVVANNPSLIALREIHNLHDQVPALFVSIGTGLKDSSDARNNTNGATKNANGGSRMFKKTATTDDVRHKQGLKKYREIGKHLKNRIIDCEGSNGTEGWRDWCRAIGMREHLYRLNVKGDLHTVSLDEWRPSNTGEGTLSFIEAETDKYLAERSVINYINSIAEKAVEIRRERAATEHWERFAVDVTYTCPDCQTRKYDTRAQLREHLQQGIEHRENQVPDKGMLEKILNTSRTFRTNRSEEPGDDGVM
ncbi:hypothetical protein H9Q72_013178 [Fusarium xylarioides]|uniref:PNPLA domain-containing protein n=2 Tax=Fusarium xylarioides TaxID=221167 RepID=A0A9P7KZT2_9HYPO|nr:hypothetical protein H9Q72_013178 [Fusarium xylarioides]